MKKYLDKGIEWLIYISVILVPLLFLPQVNSVFTTPKLYLFRVITLVIILLWGMRCLFDEKLKIRFAKIFWLVIAYAGVSIVNTFVTVNVYTSLFGTYGRFIGIFTVINLLFWIYIVFSFLNSKEKIKNLMWVSVFTSFLIAIYGLLQYFNLFVNVIPWSMNPMDRVFSTIGHSNHTAAYLGMNLMLLLSLIFNEKKSTFKTVLWIGLILLGLTLILTASRGGVFAVLVAGVFWLIFILKKKKLSKKTFKYTIAGLILAAILGILLSGPISKIGVVERTTSTITFVLQGNVPDRVSWWFSSFEMIKDKPLLGHGLSSYKDIYNKYRRTDYRVPDDAQDQITPETAHNDYLNIFATQGLIGFLIYAAMIVMLFVYTLRYMKKADDKDRIYVFGLLTALLVYLIQVSISFGTVTTLFIFYTLIGALISYAEIDKKEIQIKNNIILKFIILLTAVALFIVFGYYSLNSLRAEYHFKQASAYAAKGDLEQTIEHFENSQELMPHMAKYYEGHGDFLFELGIRMPDEAQSTYLIDAAYNYELSKLLNSNYPNVLANIGLVNSRLADLNQENKEKYTEYSAKAKEFILHAKDNSRNNPLYIYKAAQMFEFYEEYPQALSFYKEILEIRDPYKATAEKIAEFESLVP
ncbi:O-antigen ligase family protein [Patescibacteria group bacterium]